MVFHLWSMVENDFANTGWAGGRAFPLAEHCAAAQWAGLSLLRTSVAPQPLPQGWSRGRGGGSAVGQGQCMLANVSSILSIAPM